MKLDRLHIGLIVVISALSFTVLYSGSGRLASGPTLEQKQRCAEDGARVHERLEVEFASADGGTLYEPKYYFNSKLDTCLYVGGALSGGEHIVIQEWVKDVYTNEDIIYRSAVDNEEITFGGATPAEEFRIRKAELIGE